MRYPDVPNPDLLNRIPLDARTVLDVGCGTGSLLAAYRKLNPRARLLGIEQREDAARIAAQRLDAVAMVDVEANPAPFTSTGPIDCIIYGDVIEHLRDPWPVLRRHAAMLSDAGTMLICVPNVEHWSFAARLLQGTWDYEPTGLFDTPICAGSASKPCGGGLARSASCLATCIRASSMPTRPKASPQCSDPLSRRSASTRMDTRSERSRFNMSGVCASVPEIC